MVAIVRSAPGPFTAADPNASAAWLERIGAGYTPDERAAIARAFDAIREIYADLGPPDGGLWGEPALGPPSIVAGLKLDADSVRAALLLGAPFAPGFDAAAFAQSFGPDVAQIVVGAARMDAIRSAPGAGVKEERDLQAEN